MIGDKQEIIDKPAGLFLCNYTIEIAGLAALQCRHSEMEVLIMFIGYVLLVVAVTLIIGMYAVLVVASYRLIQKVCMRVLETIDRMDQES